MKSGFGRTALSVILIFCPVVLSFAQRQVRGRIIDELGEPVIGAAVVQEGVSGGTVSDIDGNWSLTLSGSGKATLVFSSLGYENVTREIGNSENEVKVVMTSQSTVLDETVVVGYGTQKKVNLTGAVSAIKVDEEFTERPVANISSGLAGLVPGLAVAQASGEAGNNSAELLIRGMGTVNDASPLIVIDGMTDLTLDRVNIEDVESISVLKDAAAASVYGARGANGVILITTKSGKSAQKTSVKLSTSCAVTQPTNTFHFLTDYARVLSAQQRRQGISAMLSDLNFKDGTVDEWLAMQMVDPALYPNTDWWNEITRTGLLIKANVSASGKTDASNFYVSGGYQKENGQFINNNHDRYNLRFNYDYKIRKSLDIGVRFDGNWTKTQSAQTGNLWTAISGIYPYDASSGRYGGAMAYGESVDGINNPLAMLNSTITKKNRQEANVSAFINWRPVKGLTLTADFYVHYYNSFSSYAPMPTGAAYNFQKKEDTALVFIPSSAGIENNSATGWKTQLNLKALYQKTFARHHDFSAMFLYNEESSFSRSMMASREERIDPSLTEINAALKNIQSTSGTSARSGLRSFVGRVNYAAFNRYLFEVNARADGYSRFTRGRQWGVFPSVSAGWRFTEEPWLKSVLSPKTMNLGKLRVSYGSLGNNTGVANYQQLNTLNATNYFVGGTIVPALVSTKIINEGLTWEKTTIFDAGLDLAFLNNRLSFEGDFYNRLTEGMIQSSDASLMIGGLSTPKRNMASLVNRGFELNLTWKDGTKDFHYSANFNISYNASMLLSWNEYLDTGSIWVGMPYNFTYNYIDTGYINQTWMDTYLQSQQSKFPGDLLLTDVNGDGIVNRYDMVASPQFNQDRPTTNYGINFQCGWKGLEFSMLWQGTYGRVANWRTSYNDFNFPTTGYAVTQDHINNQWSYDNRDGGWPRAGGGQATANMETTSYWMDDMSYLRLKSLEISYSLPKRWMEKIKFSGIKFYLSGSNLLTFTKFRGLDPEKANINDLYPLNRSYSFGINIIL
ncbi:MAG: TonB-dependent receptor [Bacteroidales bacterium]|nr:TonB-dependent receptor [Bacteroidales bacterium]